MFQTVLLHLQMVSQAHLLFLALRLSVPIANEEKTLPVGWVGFCWVFFFSLICLQSSHLDIQIKKGGRW